MNRSGIIQKLGIMVYNHNRHANFSNCIFQSSLPGGKACSTFYPQNAAISLAETRLGFRV